MRAKVFCDVTCSICAKLAQGSTFYKNSNTISELKECTRDWVWQKGIGNLCPKCLKRYEQMKKELGRDPELIDFYKK